MSARDKAWGFAIFADDMREEVGGKISLMGIYQNDFIVTAPTLPVVLPKLVVMIMYYELADAIQGDLTFRVEIPGLAPEQFPQQVIKRQPVPRTDRKNATPDDLKEMVLQFRVPFIMSPFLFATEGAIKVRCRYDDGSELRLGRLNLSLRKPEERKPEEPKS